MGKVVPVIERFWSKVEKKEFGYKTECWIWTAYKNACGYGWFRGQESKKEWGYTGRLAHRWAYEHFIGKIQEGFELDHICRNRSCVNPEHLQQVTHKENMSNAVEYKVRKDYCKKGHLLSPDNLYICYKKNGQIRRICRICKKISERKTYNSNIEQNRKKALERYHKNK